MRDSSDDALRATTQELHHHLRADPYGGEPAERAFIRWYIDARFGKGVERTIVDGAHDGGIDALVDLPTGVVVIQTKYGRPTTFSAPPPNALNAFEHVASILSDPSQTAAFNSWLQSVQKDLHETYRHARDRILRHPDRARFLYVTPKYLSDQIGRRIQIEHIGSLSALWTLYREGFTSPSESIELNFTSVWPQGSNADGFMTYVGIADVVDFMKAMELDENARLFAQNVRTDLRSQINNEIRTTYLKEPERFWLGNNGIYVVCKKAEQKGNHFTLHLPSIINGSQTLHAIASSGKKHSCKILVRVLEMDVLSMHQILEDIIRRTNSQNPMKIMNLSANDMHQWNIARFLDRFGVFYERREKEWQNEKRRYYDNYQVVKMKDVAQWLACRGALPSFGRARNSPKALFQGTLYGELFGSFDHELRSPDFGGLARLVWAGLFTKRVLKSLPVRQRQFGKIAQLLLVRYVYDAVESDQALGKDVERALELRRGARWLGIPATIRGEFGRAIKELITLQRKAQEKDPNLDFSNFFKRDELTRAAYDRCFTKRQAKRFGVLIKRDCDAEDARFSVGT
jgi:hypothetical protein